MKAVHLITLFISGLSLIGCNNLCKNIDCNEAGYCYDGACICDKWYSGEECDLMFNRHYQGLYIAEANENNRIKMDSLNVTYDEVIPNRLITDLGVYIDFVTDSTLVVPVQEVYIDSMMTIVEGSGKFGPNFLKFEFGKAGVSNTMELRTPIYSFNGKMQ